jgi:hypothetical protein
MNAYSQHLTFEQLLDLAGENATDGRAAGAPAAGPHLAECSQCRAALSGMQRMMSALQSGELPAPPQDLTARAVQLFRRAQQSEPAASFGAAVAGALRSLVAVLRFDSGLTPAFGMRSSRTDDRQLFFSVDEYDIDLRLAAGADTWRVEGQLLGGAESGTAELTGASQRYTGEMNDLGEFTFSSVVPGSYRLRFVLPQVEIVVPELALTS